MFCQDLVLSASSVVWWLFQINLLRFFETRQFPAHQLEDFLFGLEPGVDIEHNRPLEVFPGGFRLLFHCLTLRLQSGPEILNGFPCFGAGVTQVMACRLDFGPLFVQPLVSEFRAATERL